MAAFMFTLLGVILGLAGIAGWAVYLTVTSPSRSEAHLARLEELRAERRIQQLTQDAVAQMLHIARDGR